MTTLGSDTFGERRRHARRAKAGACAGLVAVVLAEAAIILAIYLALGTAAESEWLWISAIASAGCLLIFVSGRISSQHRDLVVERRRAMEPLATEASHRRAA